MIITGVTAGKHLQEYGRIGVMTDMENTFRERSVYLQVLRVLVLRLEVFQAHNILDLITNQHPVELKIRVVLQPFSVYIQASRILLTLRPFLHLRVQELRVLEVCSNNTAMVKTTTT